MRVLLTLLLVSAAVAQVPTTCTKSNGKPCAEWVHTMVGQYPPDSWPTREQSEQARVTGFFHFRSDWNSPALRNTKLSWALFIGSHAGLGLTYAIDHHLTHGARENNGSEVPAILGVSAMDFLMFKCVSPALSIGAPIYGMEHYARDASR